VAGVLSTRGRPTEIYPETALTFRLSAPLTISTSRSQHAFQPVQESDFQRASASRTTARSTVRRAPVYSRPAIIVAPYPRGRIHRRPAIIVGPHIHIDIDGRGRRRDHDDD
jgi:hypothetical protein